MTATRLTSHISHFTLFILLLQFSAPAAAQGRGEAIGITTRISVASDGTEGNSSSHYPSISADGRYVTYYSHADNLVSGDTNGYQDVFVHDRLTFQTTRVSVATDGTEGDEESYESSISGSGRYVTFTSFASNLVSGDTNGIYDIFVHDRTTGQTTRASVASDGTEGNAYSFFSSISNDGRFVAFHSYASTLVGDDTNGWGDVFVRDRQTEQTTRVSLASDGTQGNGPSIAPSISANGRFVSYWSDASTLVAGDANGTGDVFVHDRVTGQTTRVSVASSGTEGNGGSYYPSISADGRFVAFQSEASNLVGGDTNGRRDAFVHDRATGEATRISVASDGTEGNGRSYATSISATGRYVGFSSFASNLVAGDTNAHRDTFLHDQATAETIRVSVASSGIQGNSRSFSVRISASGRYTAFDSYATNLVPGDTNGFADVFVHDRVGAEP